MYTVDEKIKSFYIYTSGLAKATALLLFLFAFFLFLRSSSFYIYRIFVFLHSCFLFLLLLSFPFFFLRSFFLLFLLLSSSFIFTLVFFFIVLLLHVMGIIANPYEVSPILRCMSLRLHLTKREGDVHNDDGFQNGSHLQGFPNSSSHRVGAASYCYAN